VPDTVLVTAADIARLAGVTRATVSNWRRRHPDFPTSSGGTEASPAYDRAAVESWLAARGSLPDLPPDQRLWRRIVNLAEGTDLGVAVSWAALFLLYLHRDGLGPGVRQYDPWNSLAQLSDDEVARRLPKEIAESAADIPQSRSIVAEAGPIGGVLARDMADAAAKCGPQEILDFLIGAYAEATAGRVSVTPRPLARLMAALGCTALDGTVSKTAADQTEWAVFDPACGTGELLAASAEYGPSRTCGQELNEELVCLTAVRLGMGLIGGYGEIRYGDSLHGDGFADLSADVVLCHPPFAEPDWGHDQLAADARWEYGTPPRSESELAWVQHALAHARPGGRVVVLMPPAAASRASGRRIRAELLRRGALRAIIGLPPGAGPPRHVGLHLWVLEHPDSGDPRSSRTPVLLLVDAAADPGILGSGEQRRRIEWPKLTDTVLQAWYAFTAAPVTEPPTTGGMIESAPSVWRAASVIDLLDETVDLTPARHLAVDGGQSPRETASMRIRLLAGLAELGGLLPGGDWAPREGTDWPTTTVGDLARSGAIIVHRASAAAPGDDQVVADLDAQDGWPVLTLRDVTSSSAPSAAAPAGIVEPGWMKIHQGDVILPAMLLGAVTARVAGGEDEESILGRNLHLVRPDPDRIDPWFLSGFLASPAGVKQASYGSSVIRLDVRRLRVPLLPLAEQRRYGAEFRKLHDFNAAARDAVRLGGAVSRLLGDGLASGALQPPGFPVGGEHSAAAP
jgi:N-6 DNA Methylase